jgi:hypothetical protein
MAIGLMEKCSDSHKIITQDLIICEIDIFFKRTVLELAIDTETNDFVSLSLIQELLTDVWYDKLNPHISTWKVAEKKLNLINLFIY